MNEGDGDKVFDRSVGGDDNGTLTNDPLRVASERGPVLDFDGVNQFANCGDFDAANIGNGDFTGSCWFRQGILFESDRGVMFAKAESSVGVWWTLNMNNSGKVILSSDDGAVRIVVTSPDSYEDDLWHHCAFTRIKGTGYILYIDGQEVSTGADNGNVSSNEVFTIGKGLSTSTGTVQYWGGANSGNHGFLSDVALHGRALALGEIQQLFQDPYAEETPLELWAAMSAVTPPTGGTTNPFSLGAVNLLQGKIH
jgi:hypothetical protein